MRYRHQEEAMNWYRVWGIVCCCSLLSSVLSGCTAVQNLRAEWTAPVRVQAPRTGQRLLHGQPFTVRATVDVPYAVGAINVRLWDVTTGAEHTWSLAPPAGGPPWALDVPLTVPNTLPVGGDYRLQIDAVPAAPRDTSVGYSTQVEVAPAP